MDQPGDINGIWPDILRVRAVFTCFFFDISPVDAYHGALMSQALSKKPLPRLGDPRKFAQQGISVAGYIPISALPRVVDAVESSDGDIDVQLVFGVSEDGYRVVTGGATAAVSQICQRCLQPVSVPVACDISLAVIWSEEDMKALPSHLDPWIAGEGAADFYEMIEEELLLNLPAVAYHEQLCIDEKLLASGEPVVVKKAKNPFQVLEQLKSSPK